MDESASVSFQYAENWQTGKHLAFCEGSVVNEYIRSCNDTLFNTKIDEIDAPFKTKSSENHTLSGRTSLLRPYRGVAPPGLQSLLNLHVHCFEL